MTTQQTAGKFLFGSHNSVLWAWDLPGEEGLAASTVTLPSDQIVLLIPVERFLSYRQNGIEYRIEPGSVGIVNTRIARTELDFPSSVDAILVGIRHDTLATMLESFRPGLMASVRDLVYHSRARAELSARSEIAAQIVPAMREPLVSGTARAFWYESQLKMLLAILCFVPASGEEEFFCTRQKRLARIRVTKAKAMLETRLDESFDLGRLAAEVGCSASYLSRTFSSTVGMTISQYLRKRRVEKAADLLVTGRYNVSEVALEVGYQSLSHFSKAFQQVKGCLPSRYEAA